MIKSSLTSQEDVKKIKIRGYTSLTTFTVAVGTFPTEIGCRFMVDPLTKKQKESKPSIKQKNKQKLINGSKVMSLQIMTTT